MTWGKLACSSTSILRITPISMRQGDRWSLRHSRRRDGIGGVRPLHRRAHWREILGGRPTGKHRSDFPAYMQTHTLGYPSNKPDGLWPNSTTSGAHNPINYTWYVPLVYLSRLCLLITDACPVLPAAAQGGKRKEDGAYVLISPNVISVESGGSYYKDAIMAFFASHKCNNICRQMGLDISRQVCFVFLSQMLVCYRRV